MLVPSIKIVCCFIAYLFTYGVSTLYIVIISFIFTTNGFKKREVKIHYDIQVENFT
jgi:hypothetical protein